MKIRSLFSFKKNIPESSVFSGFIDRNTRMTIKEIKDGLSNQMLVGLNFNDFEAEDTHISIFNFDAPFRLDPLHKVYLKGESVVSKIFPLLACVF